MSNKLFVGGLSWDTNDESLRGAFDRFGEVTEAKVVTDRETGRSRGFGFVTMSAPSDAQVAAREMDGTILDGRSIRVNEAENRPRTGGGGGYGAPRGDSSGGRGRSGGRW